MLKIVSEEERHQASPSAMPGKERHQGKVTKTNCEWKMTDDKCSMINDKGKTRV